jgi:type 1 glutamine amidotransferase
MSKTLPSSCRHGWTWRLAAASLVVVFSGLVLRGSLAEDKPTRTKAVSNTAADDDEAGFKSIFNGRDLTGWKGDDRFWSVQDEAITGTTTPEKVTPGNTFITWTEGTVDDFVLRCEYRIIGGNSGIQYRSTQMKDAGEFVVGGYQADIDSGDTFSGINYEERGRGILAQRGQKTEITESGEVKETARLADTNELQARIKKEDWNSYEIIAEGNHLTHKINGVTMSEVVDNQASKRKASGILALQLHAGPPMVVQFRNIRLKRTKMTAGVKKVVMIAGTPSHGKGDHEFNAGTLLLQRCLNQHPGVVAACYLNGWPKDPTAFDNADTVVIYCDGGAGHPAIQGERLREFHALMEQGVGLCCMHYAVEVPAERGGGEFLEWIGGYYETGFSINPHWTARFGPLPSHPVTRGVKPFEIRDEWYYNIRFPADASKVTPLLVSTPPDETRRTKAAAEHPGRAETVAWTFERQNGGRGFGFTGGHVHKNWKDPNFRKFVLNAILWTAGADIPAEGVASDVSDEEIAANLDPK